MDKRLINHKDADMTDEEREMIKDIADMITAMLIKDIRDEAIKDPKLIKMFREH